MKKSALLLKAIEAAWDNDIDCPLCQSHLICDECPGELGGKIHWGSNWCGGISDELTDHNQKALQDAMGLYYSMRAQGY